MLRGRRAGFGQVRTEDDMISLSEVIQAIKSSEYVILYSPWCGYSKNALTLLNQNRIPYKSIDIENINGTMNEIRARLAKDKSIGFPESYSTRPMIFVNGKFIGGYADLKQML